MKMDKHEELLKVANEIFEGKRFSLVNGEALTLEEAASIYLADHPDVLKDVMSAAAGRTTFLKEHMHSAVVNLVHSYEDEVAKTLKQNSLEEMAA